MQRFIERLLLGIYWLGLGAWFGAIVMLAVGAAAAFGTIRGMDPTVGVAPYNDPTFAGASANVLAGAVVGSMLNSLAVVQTICAVVVVGCLGIRCARWPASVRGGVWGWRNLLVGALILAPVVMLAWDRTWLTPTIHHEHEIRYDLSTSSEAREAANNRFDRLHKLSERALGTSGLMVAAAGILSAFTLNGRRVE